MGLFAPPPLVRPLSGGFPPIYLSLGGRCAYVDNLFADVWITCGHVRKVRKMYAFYLGSLLSWCWCWFAAVCSLYCCCGCCAVLLLWVLCCCAAAVVGAVLLCCCGCCAVLLLLLWVLCCAAVLLVRGAVLLITKLNNYKAFMYFVGAA